jgi:hypothetical protein
LFVFEVGGSRQRARLSISMVGRVLAGDVAVRHDARVGRPATTHEDRIAPFPPLGGGAFGADAIPPGGRWEVDIEARRDEALLSSGNRQEILIPTSEVQP